MKRFTGRKQNSQSLRSLALPELQAVGEAVKVTLGTRPTTRTTIQSDNINVTKDLFMSKANVRREDKGSGADFINERRAVDDAVNEKLESESGENKLDPRSANNRTKATHDPHDSTKKTGRTKQ